MGDFGTRALVSDSLGGGAVLWRPGLPLSPYVPRTKTAETCHSASCALPFQFDLRDNDTWLGQSASLFPQYQKSGGAPIETVRIAIINNQDIALQAPNFIHHNVHGNVSIGPILVVSNNGVGKRRNFMACFQIFIGTTTLTTHLGPYSIQTVSPPVLYRSNHRVGRGQWFDHDFRNWRAHHIATWTIHPTKANQSIAPADLRIEK
jgi:hypothetical protein